MSRICGRAVWVAGLLMGFAMSGTATVKVNVDWPSYMAKQDLYFTALPQVWTEAPFVGNGVMGSMIFQTSEKQLTIQIGRGDVQEHRAQSGKHAMNNTLPDSSRLPVGYFTLDTVGKITGCNLRLNLWDAEISGTVSTEKGDFRILAFIHSDKNLLVVKTVAGKGEVDFSYTWHPEDAFCPRTRGGRKIHGESHKWEYCGNPPPEMKEEDAYTSCIQKLRGGGQTATVWSVEENGNTKTLLASVGHTYPDENAQRHASADIKFGKKSELAALLKGHRAWWHAFYPKSFVSLPDARMESFLWIQHYKMASTTKGGTLLADNMGVWMNSTSGWPACWWNLNIQLAYSHMLPGNHPELSEGLINQLWKYRDNLANNVPESMRHDSAAINVVSGQDLISPVADPNDPKQRRGVTTGNLTWAMHNCYMQYRYTMDEELLREKIFPLLKRSINFYRHIMREGEDGKIHLPRSSSPEYGDVEDCTYDLSLLRWGCETLIACCAVLEINDPLLPTWKDILDRLTPYPVDETGFMIGKDMPYAKSHRHYSHLMMIYPLSTMDLNDPAERELAMKSLLHWQSLPEALQGYSYTGSSSMFSLFGDGDMAEQRLQAFFDDKVLPNTFYTEGSPVLETPPAGARSIEDMLIQSWGDKIVVFPAIPDEWKNASFADLRTEGAFLVSASRIQGRTAFISVESLAGEPCRLQTGIKGEIKVRGLDEENIKIMGGGLIELTIPKGASVVVSDAAYKGPYTVGAIDKKYHTNWSWGLK